MNPRRIFADFQVFYRGYFRNAAALFFSLFFPIILIGLFGLIFSAGGGTTTLYVQNMDGNSNASVQFLAAINASEAVQVDVVSLHPGTNLSDWLGQNSNPVGMVIPKGFGADVANRSSVTVTLYSNPSDAQSSGIALGVVTGVANNFNLHLVNATSVVGVQDRPIGSTLFKYIDFLVPGLIGFSVLTSPMFSMVEIASSYKKDGLFRQLSLTPLSKAEWLTAKLLWFVCLAIISAGIMIAFGYLVFHGHFLLTWELLPFLFLGPFFFVALGMLAGTLTKTPETAAIIGNIVTFPMMFLSGTFFPVSGFPAGLQAFAHILPLYYIIDGMDQVMLYGNSGRAVVDLVIIAIAGVVVFVAAITAFKWRES